MSVSRARQKPGGIVALPRLDRLNATDLTTGHQCRQSLNCIYLPRATLGQTPKCATGSPRASHPVAAGILGNSLHGAIGGGRRAVVFAADRTGQWDSAPCPRRPDV
ncbi:hypothetical protein [Kamptonema formosum]|uniref:hypothetical protein n=1 Tax=Kamptonema formosum TaxID=331992 RepID=UPI0012DC1479|nr:hypothetical protein [Oscillatoria sp. PCC 10802]